jgi:tRNA (guanine-N7-)-methyltransferase
VIPVRISVGDREWSLAEQRLPLELDQLIPDRSAWEVELGFGKGAYLLRRALEDSADTGFLGIEIVSKYYRLVRDRARRRGCANVALFRGEALYLICSALPDGFARAVHVYHPDPWPKSRHNKRRLFDVESVDLLIGLLAPGGTLYFATDHSEYGEVVGDVLRSHDGLRVTSLEEWPDGPRTNYEAKFVAAGEPIVRLEVRRQAGGQLLHPTGVAGVLAATSERE